MGRDGQGGGIVSDIVETLIRARARYAASPCKGAFARDEDDKRVSYYSGKAAKWCVLGALKRETGNDVDLYDSCAFLLGRACPGVLAVPDVNDVLGVDAALEVFDRAILDAVIESERAMARTANERGTAVHAKIEKWLAERSAAL